MKPKEITTLTASDHNQITGIINIFLELNESEFIKS